MKRINTFGAGFFIAFVILAFLFGYILTESFVSKELLEQDKIYINGHFYKLCRSRS